MRSVDSLETKIPSQHDWRTTDTDEINRRRLRAQTETFRISNLDSRYPIFSNFHVRSTSGLAYGVEIRSLLEQQYSCECVDFRINGLGTCKHVEATLLYLEARHRRLFRRAREHGSPRLDIVPDPLSGTLRVEGDPGLLPRRLKFLFGSDGRLRNGEAEQVLALVRKAEIADVRISREVAPWLETKQRFEERRRFRRRYEQKVQSGDWPAQETLVPLYPYQREGMLHLAFKERALLADEMGLGKTIQAIAACAVLERLGQAARVLVVTPASLKTEWEEQIQRFTKLPYQLVFGPRWKRLRLYASPPFFTIVNYEQMLADALDVNARLNPDVIILDEAQRIKNWDTKTAQAVKRLRSRYAFVLTGTPIENRIDEIYSLMAFLDPSVLGPLFRFNREFYELDERGRPAGYRNLDRLHECIAPFMLRRRKCDVETELPDRTDRTFFVPLSGEQRNRYADHERIVARLLQTAKRRPLTQQELKKLLRELSMMRMICDTNYILDPEERTCPKLRELEKILEECRENPDVKVLVFSEWARMLELVRELCKRLKLGYALHTGSVPQRRRRAEIQRFKTDPSCRVFLSTESGSTGLNLQTASVVINCDLPWNPARLEQRIARAWRKHQARPVTVIHLVSEGTIEHRMLGTLALKQALSDGVLDLRGDLKSIKLASGRQAFLARLEQLVGPPATPAPAAPQKTPLPVDRSLAFSRRAAEQLGAALVRCEERYPLEGAHSVVVAVVDRDAALWQERLAPLYDDLFGREVSDPLAAVKLTVIDRATDEALKQLADAGLIAPTTRATRGLHPADAETGMTLLSPIEREKARTYRQKATRKLKMARLLSGGGLTEEEREALLESTLFLGRALAVEHRAAEPADLSDTLREPAAVYWGQALPLVREFASAPAAPSNPVAGILEQLLEASPP